MQNSTATPPTPDSPPNGIADCPTWCTLGEHARRDPHHASVGVIEAPGFVAELAVRQYAPVNGRAVAPPAQAVLSLDTTQDGRVTGALTLAFALPTDVDVEAFLAESDHEPAPATVLVAPGVTFEPYRTRPPRRGEDHRVTLARTALAKTRAALDDESTPFDAAGASGRLQAAVEGLLELVGERGVA